MKKTLHSLICTLFLFSPAMSFGETVDNTSCAVISEQVRDGTKLWNFMDYCLAMDKEDKSLTAYLKGKKIWQLSSVFSDPSYGHLYLPLQKQLAAEKSGEKLLAMTDMNGNGLPEITLNIFTYDTKDCCSQYNFLELDGEQIYEIAFLETQYSIVEFENIDDDPAIEMIIYDGIFQENGAGWEPLVPVAIELDEKNRLVRRQDLMYTSLSIVDEILKRNTMIELATVSNNDDDMFDLSAIQALHAGLVYNGNIELAIEIVMVAGSRRSEEYGKQKSGEWFKALCEIHKTLQQSDYYPEITPVVSAPFCNPAEKIQAGSDARQPIYKNKVLHPVGLMGHSYRFDYRVNDK